MTTEPRLAPLPHARRSGPTRGAGQGHRAQRKRDRRVREPNISLREVFLAGIGTSHTSLVGEHLMRAYGGGPTSVRSTPSTSRPRAGVAPGGLRRRCATVGPNAIRPSRWSEPGEGLPDGPHNRRSRLR